MKIDVISSGENQMYMNCNCDVQISYKGPPIVKLGSGAEFSMILDCKGALHSFGLPEYGQLGK